MSDFPKEAHSRISLRAPNPQARRRWCILQKHHLLLTVSHLPTDFRLLPLASSPPLPALDPRLLFRRPRK